MPLDHIDLRVPHLATAEPFYRRLLPRLGFRHEEKIDGWLQFVAGDGNPSDQFFGVTEDADHRPNANRIAFRAASPQEVDALAVFIHELGGLHIEGPGFEDEVETYYAVFFEDPWGNRLEVCHRSRS
jgi:catechol 2,3-dioxygenase-like lactoylglutathione lyase family enzyme